MPIRETTDMQAEEWLFWVLRRVLNDHSSFFTKMASEDVGGESKGIMRSIHLPFNNLEALSGEPRERPSKRERDVCPWFTGRFIDARSFFRFSTPNEIEERERERE